MLYLIAILLIDAVALAYGIWEQYTQFREQHFAEAEVIGHKAASSVNLTFKAVNAMSGMVNPIVRIAKPDSFQCILQAFPHGIRRYVHGFPFVVR